MLGLARGVYLSEMSLPPASRVLSRRHAPSFVLLALAAGAVNGGALLACERFVASVTSTLSRIGLNVGARVMGEYLLLVVAFIAGAMLSVAAVQARSLRNKRPLYALPLIVVSLLLVAAGFAGHRGLLGELGTRIGDARELAFLAALALAMGLLNATVTSSSELGARATHMTGQATDFGVELAQAWIARGAERRRTLRTASLRGAKLVAFSLGALLMVPAIGAWGYLAFLVPAAFIQVALLRSFLPSTFALNANASAAALEGTARVPAVGPRSRAHDSRPSARSLRRTR